MKVGDDPSAREKRMQTHIRSDRRRLQRHPTFGAALLFVDSGEMVECVVRDISEEGAGLHGPAITDLPKQFEAWLPTEGVTGTARITWRNRHACGIVFLEETARTALRQRIARRVLNEDRTSRMVAVLRAAKDTMSGGFSSSTRGATSSQDGSADTSSGKMDKAADLEPEDSLLRGRYHSDASVDHITALVRSRLVKLVIEGKAASYEADVLRKILGDLTLLRRIPGSGSIRIRAFGRK